MPRQLIPNVRNFTNCLSYNGTSSKSVLSTNPTGVTNNWTMIAWIMPLSLPQHGFIIYNGNDFAGYGMSIGDGGGGSGSKLEGLNGGIAWVNGGPSLTNNIWQHVGLIRRSGTWYFYLNGAETNSGSSTAPSAVTSGKASIGMQFNSSNVAGSFINALTDYSRVWNVALTKEQVAQNYTADIVPSGLVFERIGTGNDSSPSAITITDTSTSVVTSNTAGNSGRKLLV